MKDLYLIESLRGKIFFQIYLFVNLIVDDAPIDAQLYARFNNFFKKISVSNNEVVNLCSKLVQLGSGSTVSNNLLVICCTYNVNRYNTN